MRFFQTWVDDLGEYEAGPRQTSRWCQVMAAFRKGEGQSGQHDLQAS